MRDMLYDLHTHTNRSDGSLSPAELLVYANDCDVDVLAITDHDTVDAFDCLDAADNAVSGLTLITGIELSCVWQRRLIHVVGLQIDLDSDALAAAIRQQQRARAERAATIAERLTRLGIDNPLDDVLTRSKGTPGRPHFAAHLVDAGVVPDTKTAFKRYLGAGKIGDVKAPWPEMTDAVSWIVAAGGQAVLAHPAKYRMTATKLRGLVADFRQAGGVGVEICSGAQDPATTAALVRVTRDAGLLGSVGSDFHHRGQQWSRPGLYATVPTDVAMVWDAW